MISIIIPCYNHNEIVGLAVSSAIKQKVTKEIIIVDDGSRTPIRNKWGAAIRILRHETNRGLSHALNTGIAASKYDRFVILASDDMMQANYLSTAAKVLQSKDPDIISCDMLVDGRHVHCRPGSLEALKVANCHTYCAVIKKSVWEAVGGFNPAMNPSQEDWEFFLHAAKIGATWHHIPVPFHIYNRNPLGRDAEAQGKDRLLDGKRKGFHPDLFGRGTGLVAVIIPCYGQEQYLKDSVTSALNQVYPHTQAIVVDDGSPGDVRHALSDLKVDFNRVHLLRQKNKHLSGARNAGIKYAIERLKSQYLLPLDADDALDPMFVEETMGIMGTKEYIYTDVKFIGDAWHTYKLKEFECEKLARKHQHACSILMEAQMWQDVVAMRGYGYDETMQRGYEDWEFALACVEAGYCGKHLPKDIFQYRFHKDGSMRTAATKINDNLFAEIKIKHPWIADSGGTLMAKCSACGRSNQTKVVVNKKTGATATKVIVPGLGELDARTPILIQYTGATTSTMTKIGRNGTIYKYSANWEGTYGPEFTGFAIDAHLFNGPFTLSNINAVPVVEPVKPVEIPAQPTEVPIVEGPPPELIPSPKEALTVEKVEQLVVESYDLDDMTKLKHIGKAGADKLTAAGFAYYSDVAEAPVSELNSVLKLGTTKVKEVIESAAKMLG